MTERREGTEFGGVADENVEPAITVEQRRGQLVYFVEIAQVNGDERGAAADDPNSIVDLFETADRARRKNDMRALACKS